MIIRILGLFYKKCRCCNTFKLLKHFKKNPNSYNLYKTCNTCREKQNSLKCGRKLGFKVSTATRKKISAAMKNKTVSLSTRMKISKTLMGNQNRRMHLDNFYTDLLNDYPNNNGWLTKNKKELECVKDIEPVGKIYFNDFCLQFSPNKFNYQDMSISGIDPLTLLLLKEQYE